MITLSLIIGFFVVVWVACAISDVSANDKPVQAFFWGMFVAFMITNILIAFIGAVIRIMEYDRLLVWLP